MSALEGSTNRFRDSGWLLCPPCFNCHAQATLISSRSASPHGWVSVEETRANLDSVGKVVRRVRLISPLAFQPGVLGQMEIYEQKETGEKGNKKLFWIC